MRELVEECKQERLAVRGAIFAMRESALAGLRDEVKAARQTARDQRAARLVEVRGTSGAAITAARAALCSPAPARGRADADHDPRAAAEGGDRKAARADPRGRGSPRTQLEKLRPLLEKARTVPTAPGESKVEALWRYAEAHPEEMHAILEPKAEQEIAKTKAEIARSRSRPARRAPSS